MYTSFYSLVQVNTTSGTLNFKQNIYLLCLTLVAFIMIEHRVDFAFGKPCQEKYQ